jgi:NAD(P)-dependent dehydrogenase (short-subunit alcohol dehydrogenase family)
VVIAGRRQRRLDELAGEIGRRGTDVLAVRTDVADRRQVEKLITATVRRFGGVDTLVNNAGVGIAMRFEDQPLDDFRRVMDVNFWGAVYGCRAVIPIMQEQRLGGVIINISSILGKRGMPFETAYCAAKFGLAGFSESLRVELMSELIDVSTVFPGLVETEIFESAAGTSDVSDFVPKLPAADLARVIVQDARFPQPEIVMAADAQMIDAFNTLAPALLDLVVGQGQPFVEGFQRGGGRATGGESNLYAPRG